MRRAWFALCVAIRLALPQQAPETPKGSIHGQVLDSITGEPVRYAQVSIGGGPLAGASSNVVMTDQSGNFTFSGLSPVTYSLTAQHRNFPPMLDLPALPVTVVLTPDDERMNLVLRLNPAGRISGKIVNDDTEPVRGCQVWTFKSKRLHGHAILTAARSDSTNDLGEYRIHNLAAGRYYLFARCNESLPVVHSLSRLNDDWQAPRESWLPVFYPGTPTLAGATFVTVLPGGEVTGVDFRLRPTHVLSLTGAVTDQCGFTSPNDISLELFPEGMELDNRTLAIAGSVDRRTGQFRMNYVPAGNYTLFAHLGASTAEASCFAISHVSLGATQPEPLSIQLQPGITIQGTLQAPHPDGNNSEPLRVGPVPTFGPASPPKPKNYVNFELAAQSGYAMSHNVEVADDGTFEVKGLLPGVWRISVQPADPRNYLVSVTWNGEEISSREINVSSSGSLQIVLGSQTGIVRGSVASLSTFSRSVSVLLAPVSIANITMNMIPSAISDHKGQFRIENVPPGQYRVFAMDQGAFTSAIEGLIALVASRTEMVSVTEAAEQTVTAPYISSDDIYQAATEYLQNRGSPR